MTKNQLSKANLLALCEKICPKKIKEKAINFGENKNQLQEFAKANRLAHYLALEYQLDPRLVAEYLNYKRKVKNSLRKIKKLLKGKKYMIIKTFSSFPHLTNDVDVLVRNGKFPHLLKSKDSWLIQIEHEISWMGADAVSNEFAWQNTRPFTFGGEKFLVPNKELDVLIRLAHLVFEEGKIRLGELLHVFQQASKIKWQILAKEAEKMGWPKSFKNMKELLEKLHDHLFKQTPRRKSLDFPYQIPFITLTQGVIEKRAWRKLWGSRYIFKERYLCRKKIF